MMTDYLAQTYIDNSQRIQPDKTAVICEGDSITYDQLCFSSNKLAHCLRASGIARQDRVVFCMKRSTHSLVALFGILKSDAIYVPIDPKTPSKRFREIIDDCSPLAIICDAETVSMVVNAISSNSTQPLLIILEHSEKLSQEKNSNAITQDQINKHDSRPPLYKNTDNDIAYILYTSGSTGKPKGVMISHLNINNYIDWALHNLTITERDIILGTAPFHFDMSTFDIFVPMKAAATLSIAPETYLLFPKKLISYIEENTITVWKVISSLFMYLARIGSLKPGLMPTLQKILVGGEILPTKYLIDWMTTYPEKQFFNVYGPTEATGISTYHVIRETPKDPLEPVPIGKPCENTEVLLLKENDAPAQIGEIGELCIRGSGLSRGYWNAPDQTAKKFITNPLTKIPGDIIYRTGDLAKLRDDETFEFICRNDNQVKYMGYRIELSEIENCLHSLPDVRDAAVILSPSSELDIPELIAFIEADDTITAVDIKIHLSSYLPHYMLPHHILILARLPRSDRGKVDRPALHHLYKNKNENKYTEA